MRNAFLGDTLFVVEIMQKHSKVAFARCPDYSPDMRPDIEGLLAEIGGIGAFVKLGQSVLIKPNLLTARTPDQAVTTHPEIVRALSRILRDHGANPMVGDSPANVTRIEQVWAKTGFRAMCDEENIPLLNMEQAGSQTFNLNGIQISIAQPVLDADVVISVPKVKTHVLTVFTCAVKNLYGTVPGFQKTSLHKKFPKPPRFSEMLAAIYGKIKPALAIADGVLGMEGDGPSGGSPVRLGMLAASADSVALDATLCRLLGINTAAVPYFKYLTRDNLGVVSADQIELAGIPLDELRPTGFKAPGTLRGHLIPGWLVCLLDPYIWIRPAFHDNCISCGQCVKACPANALSITKGERPALSPEKCIGCCCCHEVCPEKAVEMQQSPFLSFVRRGRLP